MAGYDELIYPVANILICFVVARERDDLINSVTHLKARLEEAQKREESAYEQMKLGLEVVDKAHLEKTQVCVLITL